MAKVLIDLGVSYRDVVLDSSDAIKVLEILSKGTLVRQVDYAGDGIYITEGAPACVIKAVNRQVFMTQFQYDIHKAAQEKAANPETDSDEE